MNILAWPRLLFRFSRALSALDAGQQVVRDELLFAFLPPSERDAVTFEAYALTPDYVEGGENYRDGFFPWEEAMLDDPRVPRSGRVLLGAAGGGRELHALVERGYDVFAFEPVAPLLENAIGMAQGRNAVTVKGAYRDLVTRAESKSGPLAELDGPIDLCIIGWGSLSHVTEPEAVVQTFRAMRKLAPQAPVLASFILRSEAGPGVLGGARKLRRGLRRTLAALGGNSVPTGLKFRTGNGFYYEFSRSELTELAARAGYEVALFAELPLGHALLVPKSVA